MQSYLTAWIGVVLTAIGVVVVPCMLFLWRSAVRWTRVETKLETIFEKLDEIVKDKDKVHQEIIVSQREDRLATNRRLERLERNLWQRHRNGGGNDGG